MSLLRSAASLASTVSAAVGPALRPVTPDGVRLPRTVALSAGRGGQDRLLVDAPAAHGELYLHGAHLTSWAPRGEKEVVFTSREAVFDGATAIRGGVPLCLPWFGSGPDGDQRPSHGWGRISPWTLRSAQAEPDGAVSLVLAAQQDGVAALYEVRLGEELALTLSLRATGSLPKRVEAAQHTYLAVGDVTAATVTGLEGAQYVDKTDGRALRTQDGVLRVAGPVDRIYPARGGVTVTDPAASRRIRVEPVEATDVVVWNPWRQGAAAFHDMADDEFASMLCVECARVGGNAVVLQPGETVSVGTRIAVEAL